MYIHESRHWYQIMGKTKQLIALGQGYSTEDKILDLHSVYPGPIIKHCLE